MTMFHKVIEKDIYRCQFCTESYVTLRSLNVHQIICSNLETKVIAKDSTVHTEDNNLTNFEKAEVFVALNSNDEILATTKNDFEVDSRSFVSPVFVCSNCSKIFANQSDFKRHEEDFCFPVDKKNSIKELKINGLEIKLPTVHIQLLSKMSHQSNKPEVVEPWTLQNPTKLRQCDICQKIFSTRKNLLRHVKEIHEQNNVSNCHICQKTVNHRHLNRHIQEVHGKRLFEYCNICQNSYSSKRTLERHVREVHGKNQVFNFNCHICQKTIGSRRHLRRHIKEVHEKSYFVYCNICQTPFSNKRNLERHITEVHGKPVFGYCHICRNRFRSKRNLERHIKEVHENNLVFDCHICHKTLGSQRHLRCHIKNIHKNFQIDEKLNINSIEKTFEQQKNLEHDIIKEDVKVAGFNCHICQKTLATERYLRRHIQEMHESSESFDCHICHRQYSFKRNLTHHIRNAHRLPQSVTCYICKKTLRTEQQLQRHMKEIHESSHSFTCNICQKQYAFKRNLIAHTKIAHENLVLPECHICKTRFWTQINLERHIKYKHKVSLKTNSVFGNKSHFAIHKLQTLRNANILRFQCPNCNYRTNRQRLFVNHGKSCFRDNNDPEYDETRPKLLQENRQKNQNINTVGFTETNSTIKISFSCTECNYKSLYPFNYRRHMMSIHKIVADKIYKCQLCGESYEHHDSLSIHQKSCSVVEIESRIKSPSDDCSITSDQTKQNNIQNLEEGENIGNRQEELKRIRLFSNDEVLSAITNEQDFLFQPPKIDSPIKLTTHIEVAQEFQCPVFVCSICSDIFANCNEYETHMDKDKCIPLGNHPATTGKKINGLQIKLPRVSLKRLVTDNLPLISKSPLPLDKNQPEKKVSLSMKNYGETQCHICQNIYASKKYLLHHIKVIHGNRLFLKCHLCDKIFKLKKYLHSHIKSIHGHHRLFKCKLCLKSFKHSNSLTSHIKFVHKSHGLFKCKVCLKIFKHNNSLTCHIKFVHESRGLFKCSICQLKFNWKKNLDNHINHVHKNPYSFQCPVCSNRFSLKSSLNFHMLEMHTNVRRFQCNYCKYGTNRKSRFKSHVLLCTKQSKAKDRVRNSTVRNSDKNCKESIQQIIPTSIKKLDCRCSICGILCANVPKLLKHMEIHAEANPSGPGPSCKMEVISSRSCKSLTKCTEKLVTSKSSLDSKPPAKNVSKTRKNYKVDSGEEMVETKPSADITDLKEEPEDIHLDQGQLYETTNSAEIMPESVLSKNTKQETLKNELTDADIFPADKNIKYEFAPTVNSNDKRTALAKALGLLYQNTNTEDLSKFQCKLCHLTCLDALALNGHMKRH